MRHKDIAERLEQRASDIFSCSEPPNIRAARRDAALMRRAADALRKSHRPLALALAIVGALLLLLALLY